VPEVRIIDAPGPVLLCEGARRPAIVVSPATLARLGDEELRAALAHELAHVARRDPAWGYVLVAIRAVFFFNPAVQWLARAVVDDIEARADQAAVRATGLAPALSRAVRALFEAGDPPPPGRDASFERMFWRVRREGIERRCERLQRGDAAAPLEHGPALLGGAAATMALLIFFVV
jgi:Zn-dependent protease with chaperone function